MVLAYGVIGNTTDFGSVILGSSPSRPTETPQDFVLRGFLIPFDLVISIDRIIELFKYKEPANSKEFIFSAHLIG